MQSAEITVFSFLFPLLCDWGEAVLPPSPKGSTHCCYVSGSLWGLLFSPSCWNASELGVSLLSSFKRCYLSSALSDGDAASVVVHSWCEEGAECHEQAGGLVLLEGADTDPHLQARGQVTMWTGHQELESLPSLPVCIEMRRRRPE